MLLLASVAPGLGILRPSYPTPSQDGPESVVTTTLGILVFVVLIIFVVGGLLWWRWTRKR